LIGRRDLPNHGTVMRRLPRLQFSTFPVLRSAIAGWPTLQQQPSNGSHRLDRARSRVGFGFTWTPMSSTRA
jgi:hypothetical protein